MTAPFQVARGMAASYAAQAKSGAGPESDAAIGPEG